MSTRTVWSLLYIALLSALLYFGVRAGLFYTQYTSSTATTTNQTISFKIRNNWLGIYFLNATYTYEVDGKTYTRRELLSEPQANSRQYLQKLEPELQEKSWTIWYNPHKPSQAFIEKYFPYREIFNSVVIVGLILYFLILQKRYRR